jgi:hypothetical protein
MKQTTIWDFIPEEDEIVLGNMRKTGIKGPSYLLAEKWEEEQKTVALPEVGEYVYLILYGPDCDPFGILKSQVYMKNSKEFITTDSFELYKRDILLGALELKDYKIDWVNSLKEAREVIKNYANDELKNYNNKLSFKVVKLRKNYWQVQEKQKRSEQYEKSFNR